MPHPTRSLIPRLPPGFALSLVLTACMAFGAAASVRAQAPAGADGASEPTFLSRYDFHLSAGALSSSDPRFSWDTHFGGDLDIVDYVAGRLSMLVDYEAVLGHEYRAFDPNQGNYTLEGSVSYRAGATELAGVFHHVSRHLSDRPKRFAVDYNVVGLRALRRFALHGLTLEAQGEAGKVVERSFLDYSWTSDADLRLERPLGPRVKAFAHGAGHVYGVDASVYGRGTQAGGLAEAGVDVRGRAGVVELFVGVEKRVDAYPLDLTPQRWVVAGFRLLGG